MKKWQLRKRDEDPDRELRAGLELDEGEQRERGAAPTVHVGRYTPRAHDPIQKPILALVEALWTKRKLLLGTIPIGCWRLLRMSCTLPGKINRIGKIRSPGGKPPGGRAEREMPSVIHSNCADILSCSDASA
jgi:hypothetical protein